MSPCAVVVIHYGCGHPETVAVNAEQPEAIPDQIEDKAGRCRACLTAERDRLREALAEIVNLRKSGHAAAVKVRMMHDAARSALNP